MAGSEAKERKILVAVDEGEESTYALSWCLKNIVAENSKDTLILLYSKPPPPIYSAMDGTAYLFSTEILASMEKNGNEVAESVMEKANSLCKEVNEVGYLFSNDLIASMEKYSTELAESVMEKANGLCKEVNDVKVETRVESGDPRDVICKMAEKLGVDIVVMGSHGYGMIKRAFLGSVSNHCVQNVKCPVLIVRRPKSAAPNK